MSKVDTVIKNGRVVTPQGIVLGGVIIHEGKFIGIETDYNLPESQELIDAGGSWVLPGCVDCESHFISRSTERDGFWDITEDKKDDLLRETEAAAFGGITTCSTWLLLRNDPYKPLIESLLEWGNHKAYVDFGFYPVTTCQKHIEEMPELFKMGVTHHKAYMVGAPGSEGGEVIGGGVNNGGLYQMLELMSKFGYPALCQLHAEDAFVVEYLREKFQKKGRNDLRANTETRPPCQLAYQVITAGLMAKQLGATILPVHLTSKEEVDAIKWLKDQHVQVWGQTNTSRITRTCFDEEYTARDVDPRLAVNWTAFRYPEDHERMWQGLREGILDCVGTDHGCNTSAEKLRNGEATFWNTRLPGNEFDSHLPVFWTEGIGRNRISVERLVEVCATNPAKAQGWYPKKGAIIKGGDADLVLLDDKRRHVITNGDIRGRSDYTIYKNLEVIGAPLKMVMSRGRKVIVDGKTLGKPGHGKYVPNLGW
jgi:dihydropyrimidinase